MIKFSKKHIEKIKEVEEKFTRLKERLKHKSAKEKFEIYSDFYLYNLALNRLDRRMEQLHYDFSDDAYDNYEADAKEIKIEMEEIEKRFDDRLK